MYNDIHVQTRWRFWKQSHSSQMGQIETMLTRKNTEVSEAMEFFKQSGYGRMFPHWSQSVDVTASTAWVVIWAARPPVICVYRYHCTGLILTWFPQEAVWPVIKGSIFFQFILLSFYTTHQTTCCGAAIFYAKKYSPKGNPKAAESQLVPCTESFSAGMDASICICRETHQ